MPLPRREGLIFLSRGHNKNVGTSAPTKVSLCTPRHCCPRLSLLFFSTGTFRVFHILCAQQLLVKFTVAISEPAARRIDPGQEAFIYCCRPARACLRCGDGGGLCFVAPVPGRFRPPLRTVGNYHGLCASGLVHAWSELER